MKRRRALLFVGMLALVAAVWSYVLISTPPRQTLDQRVAAIASQMRCPVCQGESVADSSAPVAQQMRTVIREQLQEGRSEQQIIAYFQSRYGEQIVWTPPAQGFSLLAWLIPMVMLLVGVTLLYFVLRDWRTRAQPFVKNAGIGDGLEMPERVHANELERYTQLVEQELAAEDPLFSRSSKEID